PRRRRRPRDLDSAPGLARAAALARRPLVRLPRDQPPVRHRRSEERGARLERRHPARGGRGRGLPAGAGRRTARGQMRVFVAGAGGAMGRPLVRRLIAAGHEVTGTTRREERAEGIRAAGAAAAVCDVFDSDALVDAIAAAEPEVVVHALTALPDRIEWKAKEDPLAATNRLREEGTRNLIAAARAAGVRRLVAESVALMYAPSGDWVKDEAAPLFTHAPGR